MLSGPRCGAAAGQPPCAGHGTRAVGLPYDSTAEELVHDHDAARPLPLCDCARRWSQPRSWRGPRPREAGVRRRRLGSHHHDAHARHVRDQRSEGTARVVGGHSDRSLGQPLPTRPDGGWRRIRREDSLVAGQLQAGSHRARGRGPGGRGQRGLPWVPRLLLPGALAGETGVRRRAGRRRAALSGREDHAGAWTGQRT